MMVRRMINEVEHVREGGYWIAVEYLRRMWLLEESTFFTDEEWTALTGEIAA